MSPIFNIQGPESKFMTSILLVTEVKGKTTFFVPQADHLINRINQVNGYIVTKKYLPVNSQQTGAVTRGLRTTGAP